MKGKRSSKGKTWIGADKRRPAPVLIWLELRKPRNFGIQMMHLTSSYSYTLTKGMVLYFFSAAVLYGP